MKPRPSPERRKGTTLKEFLTTHWDSIAATDFFTVEVWTASGLVRYHVLFVIRLVTREVHIAGIIPEPHGPWMDQIARNLTDASDGLPTSFLTITPREIIRHWTTKSSERNSTLFQKVAQ
jgi:hypothetical protein